MLSTRAHRLSGASDKSSAERGLELVWVRKEAEEVDADWFSQDAVDLLVVLQGGLRCEFEDEAFSTRDLTPGDVLVLPAKTRCRAYRWPRNQAEPTIFIAVYPAG